MIENIHSVCINTAYVCAAGVGAAVVAYGAVRGMKFLSGGVKCVTAVSLVGSLIFGGMVVTGVHIAGAKTNDTQQVGGDLSNTNDVGQVEGTTNVLRGVVQGRTRIPAAPQGTANGEANVPALRRSRSLRPTGMAPVTDDDIARRWCVVSVSSNSVDSSIFTFPSAVIEQSNNQTFEQCLSPTIWEAAQRRGAVFGAWHIPLEGWQFPFDDYGWSNAFMRCEGVLRDSFRDASDQIRFLSPFALCPAAHWSRYGLSASRAWSATNEFGGLTVAVVNGALGNDPAKIASARLDLDPSLGEIRLRYDLSRIGETAFDVGPTVNGTNTFVTVGSNTSEVVFRRVHPEDWDYDGLPNDLDPDPRAPDAGAGWNQSDAWAVLAFPSNAAEIAALGYAAWATNRAAEANRRLVGFTVASCSGATGSQLFLDERRTTPLGPGRIALGVPDGGGYASDFTCTTNVYLVSPHVGNGEIQATLSLSNGGGTHGQTKPYRVIEPLRRLVTTEEYDGRIVNPSRLVWGTNAVLKVGVGEGSPFEATNVIWSVVSNSPGRVVPIDGWHAIVEPTAPSGKVVVEARFNDDPIQPRFVLPIVERRVVPVKAFVVEPPSSEYAKRWENGEIQRNITLANKIFAQVGVEFELMHIQRYVRSSDFWHLTYKQWYPLSGGRWYEDLSEQLCYLLDYYNKNDCIELYFIGDLSDPKVAGLKTEHGLIITRKATFQTIAHELGHALGLHDCYFRAGEQLIENGRQPINGGHFLKLAQDWGDESGRGFFEKKDSLVRMISSVLMCGVSDRKRVDIPYGSLYGLFWHECGSSHAA